MYSGNLILISPPGGGKGTLYNKHLIKSYNNQ